MFCEQCGAAVESDWRFCSACGKKVEDKVSNSYGERVAHGAKGVLTGLLSRKSLVAAALVMLLLCGAVLWLGSSENIHLEDLAVDPKKPNDVNFSRAISQYLEYGRDAPYWEGWPCFGDTAFPAGYAVTRLLIKLGFVEQVRGQGVFSVYDLTGKGRSAFTQGKGFCYGEPKLQRVLRYSEPGQFGPYMMSRIIFQYQVINIPSWTEEAIRLAQTDSDAHTIKEFLSSGPKRGEASLILTDKGWIHEKLFER